MKLEDKILLFIPGYNCEKQIVRVLKQLDENILQYITQVIMVNNRSTDNTEIKVMEFMDQNPKIPLELLKNNSNYGLGGSHKVAFSYAIENHFDYVIVLHGDDQGSIKDIIPVLNNKIHHQYDACLGARFQGKSELRGYSAFRTFGNKVYNILFSMVCGKMIYDLGSGLNIYNVNILKNKFYFRFPDNLTFNYCMIMAASYYKQKIMFFPISWREDDQISNVKLFNQAIKVLTMLARFLISSEKFICSELREKIVSNYSAKIIKK